MKKLSLAALLGISPALAFADPVSIVALAGQALVVFGSGAAVYAGYALVAASVIYGVTSSRRAAKKSAAAARDAYNANLEDRGATIISSIPPWRIVYGRATIGGSIHAMFTTDKVYTVNGESRTRKDALHYLVYVFAAHECAALWDVKIDGVTAGPFDANGWSLNSEYRNPESSYTWGQATLAPGASYTADKPFISYQAWDPTSAEGFGHYGDGYYPPSGDHTADIAITNEGKTATNNHATLTLLLTYTVYAGPQSAFRFLWHPGTDAQTVDPVLNALFPDKWTANHRLRGRAYAVVMVDLENTRFQGGPPQVTVDVTGRRVYDPRNGTTTGSSNNALCIRDFLLSKWGANASASEVNDTYSAAAANACDTSITIDIPGQQYNYTSDFTSTVDGWVGYRNIVTWTAGSPAYLVVATTSHFGYVTRDGMSFSGATNRYVRFSLQRRAGDGWVGKLYYSTAGHGYSENYRKDYFTGFAINGGVTEIVFDMHSLHFGGGDWKSSTITGLRFAFGAEPGDRFDLYSVKLSGDLPSTETQPKYTLNGSFTTDDNREAVLESMASSMNGFVTNSGSWLIVAGSWTAPVRDFGDDDLDGQISITQADTGLEELANSAKGTYYPVGASAPVDFGAYQNSTLITADGEELWLDFALPFTNSEPRARNLARGQVERTRSGQVLSIPLKLHAWNLQVGDRIRQTSAEYGLSLKTYRVTDWGFSLTGAVVVTAQEDAEEIYDETDTTLSDPTPNTNLPNPNVVQSVESLAAASGTDQLTLRIDGTVRPRVKLTWDAPRDPYLTAGSAHMEIKWRRIGKDPSTMARVLRVPATDTAAYLEDVSEYDNLSIGARFINNLGRPGQSTYIWHVVVGKTELPVNVTGLSGSAKLGTVTLTWDASTELDYAATEIRVGASWAAGTLVFKGNADNAKYVAPSVATYTFWAKHSDTSGLYSTTAVSTSVVVSSVQVGTGDIEGDAISELVTSSTGASIGLSTTYVEVASLTYVPSSDEAKVVINAGAQVSITGAGGSGSGSCQIWGLLIDDDSSVLTTLKLFEIWGPGSPSSVGASYVSIPQYWWFPGTANGSRTTRFQLKYTLTGGFIGATVTAENRVMSTQEFKK